MKPQHRHLAAAASERNNVGVSPQPTALGTLKPEEAHFPDGFDRLQLVNSCSFGPGCGFIYYYDALDNLTRVQDPNSSDRYYCYDARNLLTNLKTGGCNGATVTGLGYDDRGNVSNKNGQHYDFDFGNRLRGVTGVEGYRYDGFGRRVQTTHADQSIRVWQYSQTGQLMFGFSETAAHIQSTQQYLYLAGSLLAIVDRNWPSQAINSIKFQHTDALGTPVAETDTAGGVVQRSEYDPYGRLNNRPLTDGLGYTGHYQDAATGMTYMQQRYYDPQIGRFLSMDPVTADAGTGGNFNRYWYANNNPYKFRDPDGRLPCGEILPCPKPKDSKLAQADKIVANDAKMIVGGVAATWVAGAGAAVAVTTGAVAATTAAVGKAATAAEAAYATGGVAVYAKGREAAQVVATTSMRVTTAVAAKAGELKVATMTSPAALTAMKHMDRIADAIDGFLNPGPPPMSPAGVIAGMAASPESVITVDEIDGR